MFVAKFHSRCSRCGNSIYPGQEAEYEDGEVMHDQCDPEGSTLRAQREADPVSLRPGEVVCEVCFVIKPCLCSS